jgi:hypothetical protein
MITPKANEGSSASKYGEKYGKFWKNLTMRDTGKLAKGNLKCKEPGNRKRATQSSI